MRDTGWTEAELRDTSIETVERMRAFLWAQSYVQAGKEPIFETTEEMAEVSDMDTEAIDRAPDWVRSELARQVRAQ